MNVSLRLVELQCAVLSHCAAIRETCNLLEAGKLEGATARLEGAVSLLESVCRGQCVGMKYQCPHCEVHSPILEWVGRDGDCPHCGRHVDPLRNDE